MSSIFLNTKQQKLVELIKHNMCLDKDIDRIINNEKTPWKFKSIAFVDNSMYCHFKDSKPFKLIYGNKNLNNFSLFKQHNDDEVRVIPEGNKFIEWMKNTTLKNFCVKLTKSKNECFYSDKADIYDDNNDLIITFEINW